jgi:hypothetical protein
MSVSRTKPFEYLPELTNDEIPAIKLSAGDLGIEDMQRPSEYTRVPSEAYGLFRPDARLLLALLFSRRVFGEDAPGGWVRLGRGLTGRFGLDKKDVRRRAVVTLETAGKIEVWRRAGSCHLIRLRG